MVVLAGVALSGEDLGLVSHHAQHAYDISSKRGRCALKADNEPQVWWDKKARVDVCMYTKGNIS